MTFGFLLTIWRGASSEWLWASFGGVVVLHEVAARVMNQKQQVIDKEPTQ